MNLLDLIFPRRCGGCGRLGSAWCPSCEASIEPVAPATIDGVPLIAAGRLRGPLQRAIHRYKYEGRVQLAAQLARPLARSIVQSGLDVATLTFVPLHPRRERERGFNQAQTLAVELGRLLRVPVMMGLSRARATPAQVGLSHPERRVNVVGAFAWTAAIPPRRFVLVDDVCTTGATLEAAASAVRQAGGSIDAFAVLARAQALPEPAVTSAGQSACP